MVFLMTMLFTTMMSFIFLILVVTDTWFRWCSDTKTVIPPRDMTLMQFADIWFMVFVLGGAVILLTAVVCKIEVSRFSEPWMDTWCQEHGYDDKGNKIDAVAPSIQDAFMVQDPARKESNLSRHFCDCRVCGRIYADDTLTMEIFLKNLADIGWTDIQVTDKDSITGVSGVCRDCRQNTD